MSLASWWKQLRAEAQAIPPGLISQAEAIERVKQYATEHGLAFRRPLEVRLEKSPINETDPDSGERTVWVMALGTHRPMPFVEVDAVDGTVVVWRSLSR